MRMNGPNGLHCLIAGAGIGGLTLAILLSEAGHRVSLIERETRLAETGAGIQLAPNATRLLARIGLLEALAPFALAPEYLALRRAANAEILARNRLGATAQARFGAPFLVVHRADLQRVLLERLEACPNVRLHLGVRLQDFTQDGAGIRAICTRETGEEESFAADLLIGADGLWSRARQLAGLPGPLIAAGKIAWRTLIERDAAPDFALAPELQLWLGPKAHLVHYPLRGGAVINLVAIIDGAWREAGWSAPGDGAEIAARFAHWDTRARKLIAAASGWQRWALFDRAPEPRWSRERLTLLGDAAHPMLPFLAQGAAQAIEDAFALAAVLGPAGNGGPSSVAAALGQYETARRARSARVQHQSRQQGRIYHLGGPLARLRDLALAILPENAALDRYAWLYQDAWLYQGAWLHQASAPQPPDP